MNLGQLIAEFCSSLIQIDLIECLVIDRPFQGYLSMDVDC
jgi:hypothetical protein